MNAAQKGNAEAQYELGNFYADSWKGNDKALAEKWYMAAARQGHSGALVKLGHIYMGGMTKHIVI